MSVKVITENRKARHNFQIGDTYEAGLVLLGSEVKSLRQGSCSLAEAYIAFRGTEAYLQKSNIPPYKSGGYTNHEADRLRKLLLSKAEIEKLLVATTEKGQVVVPLKMYFKKGYVKLLIGLGKGKKQFDKRQDIKKRDVDRQLRQTLKKSKA